MGNLSGRSKIPNSEVVINLQICVQLSSLQRCYAWRVRFLYFSSKQTLFINFEAPLLYIFIFRCLVNLFLFFLLQYCTCLSTCEFRTPHRSCKLPRSKIRKFVFSSLLILHNGLNILIEPIKGYSIWSLTNNNTSISYLCIFVEIT